ncbi:MULTISPECIES: GNAT family N-acetyltransferase [Stutzerimonas stutzeri subgroup]|uniref:N-acetyltransferase n=2 Tax=Gammaproteobacteria TaxID=1236 RepID=A0A2N8R8Z4_STUST|nr:MULTISPECIES: GNAT family protein [Stutzerimonas stutzeri subgroup]KRW69418.1 GCN5 family acetyltransferase [Pseudomonas sp. TTU2014-105ASC]MDH2240874.1 GNAT family N-acetyltransferase [Pseudomonas sp. GD03909]MDH2247111.1 GNAT family N-acetyltransferase [Pseudomonas sp. GD03856]MDH2266378.1 GNAT family N-acetyltransferase [Pseudomonas sp. GD03855]EHY77399.1 acetyltransferase [Stutzerimonas stutzeri ATCC 14405 = CCUG 16156]
MLTPHPVTLQRGALRLEPLMEADIPELAALAERNRGELTYMNGPLRPDWYRHALADQREGRAVVFTVRMAERVIGTTRFSDFVTSLPAAELGWTWLDQAEHGTGLNASMKFLLLRHAFEEWRLVRLQLKTAASNLRSQRAIEKLGALREGVLRNHRRLADGRLDDTVLYSITDQDWPQVRQLLAAE